MPGLTEAQESSALSLRKTLYLPLDDLRYITRACIHAVGTHTGLARRHGTPGSRMGAAASSSRTPCILDQCSGSRLTS